MNRDLDPSKPGPLGRHRKDAPVEGKLRGRTDDANAFIPDPAGGPARTDDTLAETLAEEYLAAATSAEEVSEDVRDAPVPEEFGGPFVQVEGEEEFDTAPDGSNPEDAAREPLPSPMRGV